MVTALSPGDSTVFGELARRLHADVDGKLLAEYRQSFATMQLMAQKRLHEPLSTEEFATRTAMADGARLGAEVITAVWDSLHA